MQDNTNNNNQYHYDFSYSITFDLPIQQLNLTQSSLQNQFIQWCQIFASLSILKTKQKQKDVQYSKSTNLLFRLPIFRKLGLLLLQLCILTNSQTPLQQQTTKTQKIRQSIYTCLQELQQVLGADRNKYVNVVIMCLYAIVQRVIEDMEVGANKAQFQDQFEIFHIIYWEIKGQLINKQNMQAMIVKMFNVEQFHKFMYRSKEQLSSIRNTSLNTSINAKNLRAQPLTFRASINNQQNQLNKQFQSGQLYQSFKQIPKIDINNYQQRKQKQNISQYHQTQQIYCNTDKINKLNFDTFRKKTDNQRQAVYKVQVAEKISPRPSITKQQDRVYQTNPMNNNGNNLFSNTFIKNPSRIQLQKEPPTILQPMFRQNKTKQPQYQNQHTEYQLRNKAKPW